MINPLRVDESATYNKPFLGVYERLINPFISFVSRVYEGVYERVYAIYQPKKGLLYVAFS